MIVEPLAIYCEEGSDKDVWFMWDCKTDREGAFYLFETILVPEGVDRVKVEIKVGELLKKGMSFKDIGYTIRKEWYQECL